MEKQVKNHLLALVLINTYFKASLTFFAWPNAKGSLIDWVIRRLMLPFKCKKRAVNGSRVRGLRL